MSRITLAELEALPAPKTYVPFDAHQAVSMHAAAPTINEGPSPSALTDARAYVEWSLSARTAKLSAVYDEDLAALFALGFMATMSRGTNGHVTDTVQAVRGAIAECVHDLLDRRPELLHPNVRVTKGDSAEGVTWLLRYLVLRGVALNPARLVRMAETPGDASRLLQMALQEGKSFGAPLLEEALNKNMACASAATAIVLADAQPPELDDHNMAQLWTMCAAGAAARQWQFDLALKLAGAIRQRQDAAGGDGHRIPWPATDGFLEERDLSWANARAAHPVTGLLYETASKSAYLGETRVTNVRGFPGLPMAAAAAALNAILEPDSRLPLSALGGEHILKLTVLCPKASENAPLTVFWQEDRRDFPRNSPADIIDWALRTPDASGQRVQLSLLDERDRDFRLVMGDAHFSELRAKVAKGLMDAIMDGASPASASAAVASGKAERAVPARRRAKAV